MLFITQIISISNVSANQDVWKIQKDCSDTISLSKGSTLSFTSNVPLKYVVMDAEDYSPHLDCDIDWILNSNYQYFERTGDIKSDGGISSSTFDFNYNANEIVLILIYNTTISSLSEATVNVDYSTPESPFLIVIYVLVAVGIVVVFGVIIKKKRQNL